MTTMVDGDGRRNLNELLAEYERTLIEQALMAAGGHQRRAARALGILPTTLHEKMKRLGLRPARQTPAQDGFQEAV